jgi:hypothetical protein
MCRYTIHEWHAHPVVRNVKRRGTTDTPSQEEEVTLLKELDQVYKNHKYPNLEISKHLTTKTSDQISSKRKALRIVNDGASLQESTQEAEGGCDPVNLKRTKSRFANGGAVL